MAKDDFTRSDHPRVNRPADPRGDDRDGSRVIDGPWGYACVEADAVFIPAVMATPEYPLRRVLAELFAATGQTRMIFSAILNPEDFRPRLRNIAREWDEYVPQLESYSHCIEIRYELAGGNQGAEAKRAVTPSASAAQTTVSSTPVSEGKDGQ